MFGKYSSRSRVVLVCTRVVKLGGIYREQIKYLATISEIVTKIVSTGVYVNLTCKAI